MKFTHYTLIIGGALLCTTLGIDATDTLRGSQSTMFAQLVSFSDTADASCPPDMRFVSAATGTFCIDTYEAGVGSECRFAQPGSTADTASNVNDKDCVPVSNEATQPWTYVTYHQAAQLCGLAGKRLPSPTEWYQAALGTRDDVSCITRGGLGVTGSAPACVSGSGVYDMIGNVWEYVEATAVDGKIGAMSLPPSGYVATTDAAGLPLRTSSSSDSLYGGDYVWQTNTGVSAILRGGFYGAGTDAGLYSTHAATPLEFGSAAIGFRCAMTLAS
jgi:formylglycine-generating enzyme required for sulfatase activity